MSFRSNILSLSITALLAPALAQAQIPLPGIPLPGGVELKASNGIEWQRNNQSYVARGGARVAQGNVSIEADEIGASYGKGATGQTRITRFYAKGNVRIDTDQEQIRAGAARYETASGYFLLSGGPITIRSKDMHLVANEKVEYWQAKRLAIATGRPVVTQGSNSLRANTLRVTLKPGTQPGGQLQRVAVQQIEASGDVLASTVSESIRGNHAVYNASTGLAIMTGNVVLEKGTNKLQGNRAELNLKTGVSRLINTNTATSGNGTGGRVKGTLNFNSLGGATP